MSSLSSSDANAAAMASLSEEEKKMMQQEQLEALKTLPSDLKRVMYHQNKAILDMLKMQQETRKFGEECLKYTVFPKAGQQEYFPLSPMENCAVKAGMAGVMGAAFGGFLGLFMGAHSTVSYDPALVKLSTTDQMRYQLRQMKTATASSAKNFGAISVVIAGLECGIEKYRAKADSRSALYAGAITGGLFAIKGGPVSAVVGAAGMALFTSAFEYYQHHM